MKCIVRIIGGSFDWSAFFKKKWYVFTSAFRLIYMQCKREILNGIAYVLVSTEEYKVLSLKSVGLKGILPQWRNAFRWSGKGESIFSFPYQQLLYSYVNGISSGNRTSGLFHFYFPTFFISLPIYYFFSSFHFR